MFANIMTHFYVCISTRSFYGPVCAASPDTLAAEVPYDTEVPLNEARTAAASLHAPASTAGLDRIPHRQGCRG